MLKILPLLSAAALAAVLAGCGEQKKVKECNAFVGVVNGGVDRVQKNINTAPDGGTAVNELNTLATEMDAIAAETGKIEVTLPELQKVSKRYQTMVGEIAAAARELATAVDNVDRDKMNSSQEKLDQAVKAEGPLVDELNKFCQSP
jgi:DNA repair ATPase RecN